MGNGPIVVAVLSHRDAPLVRRLVQRILEGEQTIVLLHHDPRSEPLGIDPSDRIRLVADAQPCDWGRMSLALAMTRCLRAAATQVRDLDWVLLVSGQDYPTRHLHSIEADLAETSADAMLRYFRVTPEPQTGEHPWQVRCRERYLHRIRLPGSRRSLPFPRHRIFGKGTDLYIGDMWVNLSAPAVDHVLAQQQRRPDLTRYFGRCSVPDEAYVPTLLLNDSPGLDVSPERHRYISWTPGQPHPRTLDLSDLALIQASTPDFFARKVDPGASASLLDRLDAAASTR